MIRLLTWGVHLTYLFYRWLHLGCIDFSLVICLVFCAAPEILYYWYGRNARILDVLTMELFLPQDFHWIISATWRREICRFDNSSSSIDTYPGFAHWRGPFSFADRRRINTEAAVYRLYVFNSIGVKLYARDWPRKRPSRFTGSSCPALSWAAPAQKVAVSPSNCLKFGRLELQDYDNWPHKRSSCIKWNL